MVTSLNKSTDAAVPDERKNQLFCALWPKFEKEVAGIPHEAPTAKHMRPHHEILEELVSLRRQLQTSQQTLTDTAHRIDRRADAIALQPPGFGLAS